MLLVYGDGKEFRYIYYGECCKDKKMFLVGMFCNDVSEYFEKVNFCVLISYYVLKR